MFEEEFKKESDGKTYLLLRKTKEAFEEEMIRRTVPVGVLPMVRSEQGDRYKYEITGRKNLAVTFERVPMNAEQIESVLYGILDVVGNGKEYLLSEDNYVLQPEYIYLQIPEYRVTLCYYPEYGIPFCEQLGKLFEILLNRVDYREEKAISLVYALYMQLQEPDVTLERIREKIKEQTTSVPPVPRMTQREEFIGETKYREREQPEPVKKSTVSEQKGDAEQRKPVRKSKLWDRLRKEVGAKLYGRDEKEETVLSGASVSCVCEDEARWETHHTRVLCVKKETVCPAIISVGKQEKIFLGKFPFYVGSMPDYMDHVIERDTVSRFHAKFIKQGERVCLTDLNSTNGTWVNGKELNVREQVFLSEGDHISFADAEYVFSERTGEEKG